VRRLRPNDGGFAGQMRPVKAHTLFVLTLMPDLAYAVGGWAEDCVLSSTGNAAFFLFAASDVVGQACWLAYFAVPLVVRPFQDWGFGCAALPREPCHTAA